VLSAADVHSVVRGDLELTTPLAGDLRPIEEITIRSRIEGDLVAVAVREGDAVRAGATLARFDDAEVAASLAAARADVAAARADVATTEWNLTQARELFRAGAIAEQALKAAEQGALAATARLAAADARERSAALADRDAIVAAPARGTIGQRLVQTGERVARGAVLFTLVRDDSLELAAAIPARSAGNIAVGQSVRFVADGRNLVGRIARVSPTVDPTSRAVTVYVRLANPSGTIRANTFASGRVVSATRTDVLRIPREAVRQGQGASVPFVYRIEGDEITVVPVRLGDADDAAGLVEVVDGLAEMDRIVVGNVGTIGRGMRVQILDGDRGGRGGR
jgi:membrane fusion protein, multidrug efflux system